MVSDMSLVLGIDIGGSGVKGAAVDLEAGKLASDRVRIPTPKKSTPENVAEVVKQIADQFANLDSEHPIGITIPAPVVRGKVMMMANLDKSWVGLDADSFFSERIGRPVKLVNDADAAGYAEVFYGAAKDQPGVVIVTTLGTGIGTAIINNGQLLPNTELGHLEIGGHDAESKTSSGVREAKGWSYKKWAAKLQKYYSQLEKLFWPDLFVVGGGVSKQHEKFLPRLELRTPIVPAQLRNEAGIIGAALHAAR